eukprot:5731478-Pleurochrysis_carterae.AAC.1
MVTERQCYSCVSTNVQTWHGRRSSPQQPSPCSSRGIALEKAELNMRDKMEEAFEPSRIRAFKKLKKLRPS